MGTAVWEFMWCIDKITKIDDEQTGWVLGGKPVNLKDIKEEIGITEPKISKNLKKLKDEGYLIIKRTPYGLIIRVNKAYKRFNQKGKSQGKRFAEKGKTGFNLRGKSNVQKGKSNKTITVDNNNNMQNKKFCFQEELKKYLNDKREHIRIIGIFMREMKLKPENKDQLKSFTDRSVRAASKLKGYSEQDIIDTLNHIRGLDYITKITIETIGKYIDGVIAEKKSGRKIKEWQEVFKDGKIVMRPIYQ
jgi:DNA-binding Lrp family transcriptional regulator